ncbi:hypothetical protein [Desulfosporosinus acidiphilus]|uniref:GHMP family kinase ATP-binding protein n=1 Tax=Desulfosporosinus acidiphilus TaxID=885581 RepID=UPI000257AB25|nr:hypothetical protein [Desulfosporosinus acidiphilus]
MAFPYVFQVRFEFKPIGVGLSSSASIVMVRVVAVNYNEGFEYFFGELTRLAQREKNEFVDVNVAS